MSADKEQGSYAEITPEMVAAGTQELRSKMFGEALEEIVTDVFVVMLSAMTLAAVPMPPQSGTQGK